MAADIVSSTEEESSFLLHLSCPFDNWQHKKWGWLMLDKMKSGRGKTKKPKSGRGKTKCYYYLNCEPKSLYLWMLEERINAIYQYSRLGSDDLSSSDSMK